MNFKIIKEVIIMLKKKLRCHKCKKSVSNKEIFIDSVTESKVVLRCECSKCQSRTVAEIALLKDKVNPIINNRVHKTLQLKSKKAPTHISSNDILDVKNFLKTFKGDFKEIFKN